ncbi:MAG TPA: hypothetical protein VFV38_50615 [Ktedonobacteraceae bacterium]|nr:hypothetical protein [Ktedonobacteraceae bacterium]
MQVSRTSQLAQSRAFFIPDGVTKHQPLAEQVRHTLYGRCRRVLDTWAPALDWCLAASGRAELLIALAGRPILPNAGMLILEEGGGTITDLQGHPFQGQESCGLLGSNGTGLHDQLLHLVHQFA